uniref:Uncharacterized protein n=1 Tax=viral metagenome TaxID=1070528 RepID=A0A6C0ESB1_9ZZZZ
MQNITIDDYNLFGDYKVKEQNGKFYKFRNEKQIVIVPESDIKKHIENFDPLKKEPQSVRSFKYNLAINDKYTVEEQNGRFYEFTDNSPISVPESDIGAVKGFEKNKVLENDPNFDDKDIMMKQNVTSEKYKLSGVYGVEKTGDSYIFTKPIVYVPESSIVMDHDDGKVIASQPVTKQKESQSGEQIQEPTLQQENTQLSDVASTGSAIVKQIQKNQQQINTVAKEMQTKQQEIVAVAQEMKQEMKTETEQMNAVTLEIQTETKEMKAVAQKIEDDIATEAIQYEKVENELEQNIENVLIKIESLPDININITVSNEGIDFGPILTEIFETGMKLTKLAGDLGPALPVIGTVLIFVGNFAKLVESNEELKSIVEDLYEIISKVEKLIKMIRFVSAIFKKKILQYLFARIINRKREMVILKSVDGNEISKMIKIIGIVFKTDIDSNIEFKAKEKLLIIQDILNKFKVDKMKPGKNASSATKTITRLQNVGKSLYNSIKTPFKSIQDFLYANSYIDKIVRNITFENTLINLLLSQYVVMTNEFQELVRGFKPIKIYQPLNNEKQLTQINSIDNNLKKYILTDIENKQIFSENKTEYIDGNALIQHIWDTIRNENNTFEKEFNIANQPNQKGKNPFIDFLENSDIKFGESKIKKGGNKTMNKKNKRLNKTKKEIKRKNCIFSHSNRKYCRTKK